jgi:hypothetical protein
VNSGANFPVNLTKSHFPYMAQTAKSVTVDSLALYAANGTKVVSVTPNIDLAGLSTALNNNGPSALSLPADPAVLVRTQAQQVFMIIGYHFVAK